MDIPKRDRLKEVVDEIRRFRSCGPSDDPDEITAVTSGYLYLLIQLQRLAAPILPNSEARRLNAIEVEIDNIYSVYEAKPEVDALLLDIETALNQTENKKVEANGLLPLAKESFRLFISHLAEKKALAADLQANLTRFGISSFVAHNDIEPSQEWLMQIVIALRTCDALVVLQHEKFHESKWTDQEIGFALGRGTPVFPVSFDGQIPYGFFGGIQAFKGHGKSAGEIADNLFNALCKHEATRNPMSKAMVHHFINSETWAQAKERIRFLDLLEYWEPAFSGDIRTALKNNFQISNAFGVPAKVESLLVKWEK